MQAEIEALMQPVIQNPQSQPAIIEDSEEDQDESVSIQNQQEPDADDSEKEVAAILEMEAEVEALIAPPQGLQKAWATNTAFPDQQTLSA